VEKIIMYNNDAHYEAPYDDQAEHDELAEQVYEYMRPGEKFDPSELGNFAEAIGQDIYNKDLQDFIKDCVEKKEWEKLGRKLYMVSYEYMEKCAEIHLT
jgi:uncharacterized protein YfkK (UPF0435 family)